MWKSESLNFSFFSPLTCYRLNEVGKFSGGGGKRWRKAIDFLRQHWRNIITEELEEEESLKKKLCCHQQSCLDWLVLSSIHPSIHFSSFHLQLHNSRTWRKRILDAQHLFHLSHNWLLKNFRMSITSDTKELSIYEWKLLYSHNHSNCEESLLRVIKKVN